MDYLFLEKVPIKSKNYCPNPVVKNGIPAYADALLNPKVKETMAYQEWWKEQLYYIHNGYTTGGIHIPGRYYAFVNFGIAQTVRGVVRPEIHDFQLDYAYMVEYAKQEGKNILVPKGRRKSVSEMNVQMVVDYGYRYLPGYKAAVVAADKKYVNDFITKWKFLDSNIHEEFRVKQLKNDKDEIIAGWKEKQSDGSTIERGTRNMILKRTVHMDPNVLKGLWLNDVVLEESGENKHLIPVYNGTRDCLTWGDRQVGVMHIYGTGDKMNEGSKDFKEMWHDYEKFNCIRYFVPATIFLPPYYAGSVDEHGKVNEDIPNLQHLEPHERIGMSDELRAAEVIKIEREKLSKAKNLEAYHKYLQNNPMTPEEVFAHAGSNNFPTNNLNAQGYKIDSELKKYNKWKLEFVRDTNGKYLHPLQVEAIPAKNADEEEDCVMILNDGHPIKGYRNLDVAGIDSYDKDQTKTSKSLGAMVVLRRQHTLSTHEKWLPVAIIRTRPKRKEIFYEMCMKLSVYYNLVGSTLIDVANGLIFQHYINAGCERYLSERPNSFESPNSEQMHKYGVALTGYSKPRMIGAIQTYFYEHCHKIWFPQIIEEALNYDEGSKDSDNDIVDAFGIALMKALDMTQTPYNEEELLINNPYQYPEWGHDEKGNIVDVTSDALIQFDPTKEDIISYRHRVSKQQDRDEESVDSIYGI